MAKHRRAFSPKTFLTSSGVGRKMMSRRKGQAIYAQGGTPSDTFEDEMGNRDASCCT
jgi:hypothetical protein